MLIFKGKKKSASELSPEEWILHPHEPGLDEEKRKHFSQKMHRKNQEEKHEGYV